MYVYCRILSYGNNVINQYLKNHNHNQSKFLKLNSKNQKKVLDIYFIKYYNKKYSSEPESNDKFNGGCALCFTGGKQYINLQKGGKRLIHTGVKGGKYYMKGGRKVYLK